MLDVDVERLCDINETEEIMIASRSNYSLVKKEKNLLEMRVIPLMVSKAKWKRLNKKRKISLCQPFVLSYLKTAGVVTTGSEVYQRTYQDTFTPVIIDKLKEYGIEVCMHMNVMISQNKLQKQYVLMKEAKVDIDLMHRRYECRSR